MRRLRLWSDLQWSKNDREAQLQAMGKLSQADHVNQKLLFDYLYQALGILDTKSGNLMRVNSFLFTISTFLISSKIILINNDLFNPRGISLIVAGIASFISGLLLLSVIWVHWSATEDLVDAEAHKHHLLHIRNSRTVRYRIAWLLSLLSLVGLLIHLSFVVLQPIRS